MRDKIFAVINVVVGTFDLLAQLTVLIAVYPKLAQLYKDMGVQIPLITQYYPFLSVVFVAFLIYVLFTAINLLRSKNPSKSLYRQNLVFTIVLFVVNGLFLALFVMSFISPIYSLTKSL